MGGSLSSRIRFSNFGFLSEILIFVVVATAGSPTSAGSRMRSGAAADTNASNILAKMFQSSYTSVVTEKWITAATSKLKSHMTNDFTP